jgi:hypothetical protein
VADITVLKVNTGDITNIIVRNNDITTINVKDGDITTLMSSPATINVESIRFSDATPSAITRTTSAGVSSLVSRSDHSHSAASLLLDGGNY